MISETYRSERESIKENIGNIAYAIAMSVADGDEVEAKKNIPHILKTLGETQNIVVSIYRPKSSYDRSIEKIGAEIGEILEDNKVLGIVKLILENKGGYLQNTESFVTFDSTPKYNEIEKIYKKNEKTYKKLMISYSKFENLYIKEGIDKIKKLDSLIAKFERKFFLHDFKEKLSSEIEMHKFSGNIHKKFENIAKEYKITSLEDLLDLRSEIDCLFKDENEVDGRLVEIVKEGKENFKKRMGEDYKLSEKDAKKLMKTIDKIYSFSIYQNIFESTNFRELFKMGEIPITENNLKFAYIVMHHFSRDSRTAAFCLQKNIDIGEGKKPCCVYLESHMKDSQQSENRIVVHELIHALEPKEEDIELFSNKYKNINEAMTEYLALNSLKYLHTSVLGHERFATNRYFPSGYDSMLPLVETLKESPYWRLFMSAKFNGDLKSLEKTLGKDNLKLILDKFNTAIEYEIEDKEAQSKCSEELKEILNGIQKERKEKSTKSL